MDKNEIFEMVIQEMTEHALLHRRKTCNDEEKNLYQEIGVLAEKKWDVLAKLSPEDQQVVEDYIVKINLLAQHESAYLYVQGAKDCVEMLQKLGVL